MIWLRLAMFAPVVAGEMAVRTLAVSAAARVVIELTTDEHVSALATLLWVLLVDLWYRCLRVLRGHPR